MAGLLTALLISVSNTPTWAQAGKDTLFFSNGSNIVGELLGLRLGKIDFHGDDIGVIKVKHTKLDGLSAAQHMYRIETLDNDVFQSLLYRSSIPGNVRVLRDGNLLDLNIQDITSLYYFGKEFRSRIHAKIGGGYSYTKSSEIGRLNASSAFAYNSRNSRLDLSGNLIYTSDSSAFARDRENASLRYFHYFKGALYAGATFAYQRNLELGLLRRWQEAMGLGCKLLRSRRQEGALLAGFAVNQELNLAREKSVNQEAVIHAAYSLFSFSKPNLSFSIEETGYYSFSQRNRYRLDGNLALSWKIVKNFRVEMDFYHNFDTKSPGTGMSRTDYGYVFGLTFEFPDMR